MGVKGLWEILDEAKCYTEIIDLSALRGKVLAVDVSIWLYQFIKAVPSSIAHKHDEVSPLVIGGLFQRVCRLLHHGIRPIFVFDGAAPTLKCETIKQRQALKRSCDADYQRVAKKLLRNRMKLAALDSDTLEEKPKEAKILPPIDQFLDLTDSEEEIDSSELGLDDDSRFFESFITDSDAFMDIDINSADFKRLPFHIQEQILFGYRKRTLNSMEPGLSDTQRPSLSSPEASLEFSKAQVESVIKRRRLMCALESIRGTSLIAAEDASAKSKERHVASNSEKAFVFVKNSRAGWSFVPETEADEKKHIETEPVKEEDAADDDDAEFMASLFGNNRTEDPVPSQPLSKPECSALTVASVHTDIAGPETAQEEAIITMPSSKTKIQLKEIYERFIFEEESNANREPEAVMSTALAGKEAEPPVVASAISTPVLPERGEGAVLDQELESFVKSAVDGDTNYSDLMAQLQQERDSLYAEFESLQTASATPTKALTSAFMQLLHDFGLPFIVSPFEAEAQCAALDGIVDGVISDDSDCLLFGATRVYRHVFAKSGCKLYCAATVSRQFTRADLIVLAHLLGCDYCVGVSHFGPKRAVELLKTIKTLSGCSTDSVNVLIGEIKALSCSTEEVNPRLQKLLRESLPSSFGEQRITDAFYRPMVEVVGKDGIKWRAFDMPALCDFMVQKASWPRERTKRALDLLKNQRKPV